jgi:hypothetical protein
MRRLTGVFLLTLVISLALRPSSAWACAACYGQDGGPLASGMNWGIASLLGMIVLVLGGVAGFFVYLAKRSAALSAAAAEAMLDSPRAQAR